MTNVSPPPPDMTSKPAARHALVIGNKDYMHENNVERAFNDAEGVAKALEDLGWKIWSGKVVTNANLKDMKLSFKSFIDAIPKDEVSDALIYFAGHGTAVGDKNYLLPTDIERYNDPTDFGRDSAVGLADWVEELSRRRNVGQGVFILDCCRSAPDDTRSTVRGTGDGSHPMNTGFAPEASRSGTLVAYSTARMTVAHESLNAIDETHSTYTGVFLDEIKKGPNRSILDLLGVTRARVRALTDKKQVPDFDSLLERPFSLDPNWPAQPDVFAWREIKDRTDPESLDFFVKRFEGSEFSKEARSKLKHALEKQWEKLKADNELADIIVWTERWSHVEISAVRDAARLKNELEDKVTGRAAWAAVENDLDAKEIEKFIRKHPNFIEVAQKVLDQRIAIEEKISLDSNNQDQLKEFIDRWKNYPSQVKRVRLELHLLKWRTFWSISKTLTRLLLQLVMIFVIVFCVYVFFVFLPSERSGLPTAQNPPAPSPGAPAEIAPTVSPPVSNAPQDPPENPSNPQPPTPR